MIINKYIVKAPLLAFMSFVFSFFTMHASADSLSFDDDSEYYGCKKCENNDSPEPKGYGQTIVFLGNGVWRTTDGGPFVDGLIGGDGLHFQRKIMGRSDEEIEEQRQLALEFFKSRFGLDGENDIENVYFSGLELDPRNKIRAYTASGADVPPQGWAVRDGGWVIAVTNPEGVTLGGELEGVFAPAGTLMVYGEYNIKVPFKENIIIHYESDFPFIGDQFGGLAIRCRLYSEDFGVGLTGGIGNAISLDDNGLIQQDIRNILTFSPDI